MVERIALSAVVLIGVLAVFLGTPRVLTDDGGWPDVMGGFEAIAQSWQHKPRYLDAAVAVVGIILLGLGVSMFREAELIAAPDILGWVFLIVGFPAVYVATYINARRSDLSSAEATLIGATLVGVVLLVAIVGLLLDI